MPEKFEVSRQGPRLGRTAEPQNYSAHIHPSDARPADRKRMWLVTTLAASVAAASLIGVGFMAAQRADTPTPFAKLKTARVLPTFRTGAPLFTGAVQLEPVELTTNSLRGSLYGADEIAPRPVPAPFEASVMAPPLPGRGEIVRGASHKPHVIEVAPIRLASLSPDAPSAILSQPVMPLEPRALDHTFVVAPGDTFGALLGQYDIGDSEQKALVDGLKTVFAPRALRAGQELTLTVTEDGSGTVVPIALRFDTDFGEVHVSRKGDGTYVAELDGKPAGTAQHHRALARIENSLYGAAREQKVPDSIIVRMMNTHAYDVDFQREIHPGDSFEVFYSRGQSEDGEVRGRGTLLYSSLTTGGKKRSYYRFTTPDGETDYYDEKGLSSRKPLMRTPIDGARISSTFGMRRHPILGYSKMHTGTDFAAASGTPILAAGDGKVDFAGRNGGYGNYVRLEHDSGVETAYAHMKRFAKGIKKGSRVRQGQIIGFVGTTGRSTGPHLHYEVMIKGKRQNPLKVKIAGSGRKLAGKELKAFEAERGRVDKLRRDVPATTFVAAAKS